MTDVDPGGDKEGAKYQFFVYDELQSLRKYEDISHCAFKTHKSQSSFF
jgi:hypothetical protein